MMIIRDELDLFTTVMTDEDTADLARELRVRIDADPDEPLCFVVSTKQDEEIWDADPYGQTLVLATNYTTPGMSWGDICLLTFEGGSAIFEMNAAPLCFMMTADSFKAFSRLHF